MSVPDRNHADPSVRLTRPERRAWRRIAKRLAAEHRDELAARLSSLKGQPVADLLLVGPRRTIILMVPEWQLAVFGVAPCAAESLRQLSGQSCLLADAGRYGRFWWVRIASAEAATAFGPVVLGSHIRVDPIGSGPIRPRPDTPTAGDQVGSPLYGDRLQASAEAVSVLVRSDS